MNFFYNNKYKISIKEKVYIMKILLIIIGLKIKYLLDNSISFKWIKSELLQIKGIKLYSIFKIIEYILLITNKFGHDLDLQLIKIINAKKIKHKILSFIIYIIFLYANIFILILFYYCTWLIITDDNKSFIPIYLKVNYIEFKQSNKSFKSIHNYLSNEIYDRFLNYYILFFIFINCFNKINFKLNITNIYFKRILFCYIAEIISDYLKGVILFKISNIDSKNIKKFLKEEIIYYRNLKDNIKDNNDVFTLIKNVNLFEQYLYNIDKENILPMILNINIFPFCIILLYYFLFQINFCFTFKIIIFLFLICLKKINEKIIDCYIYYNITNNDKKGKYYKCETKINKNKEILEGIKRE